MSTVLIVVGLIVVFVIIVALVLYVGPGRGTGKAGLRRRFGPEYDRVVARHDGNTAEAEHELKERVERHGGLRVQPLTAERRDQWSAQWAALQEGFVESPREAVARAERLIADLAAERGFPAADSPQSYDDQLDALSVHHARRVDGYRRMRLAAGPGAGPRGGGAPGGPGAGGGGGGGGPRARGGRGGG
ncbi:hypothetical protein, partial [Streptomyces sp. 8L]|uniref:hypothetical protein n=1 Tax=Streptomyces sp. 8L TaxID=2877242 RepID=UPI001CD6DB12